MTQKVFFGIVARDGRVVKGKVPGRLSRQYDAHLLLRTGAAPLSTVMARLLTGYATSYNLRHRRSGHLFQNRYKSIICQEEPYVTLIFDSSKKICVLFQTHKPLEKVLGTTDGSLEHGS